MQGGHGGQDGYGRQGGSDGGVRRLRFALATDPVTGLPVAAQLPVRGPVDAELPGLLEPLVAAAAPAPGDSLGFARLSHGGGAVLCHVPEDAGGGEVAEVLYLPAGAADGLGGGAGAGPGGGLLPIDLWRSPAWRARGWPEDAAPGPGGELSEPRVAAFARAHAERLVPFLSDVRRLFASPAGRQLVVVEEDQAAVALWIAVACRFLRRFVDGEDAAALTFTTRTRRPHEAPQQILGVGRDAEFDRKDPDILRHRYRVHDGLGGEGSPPRPDAWVAAAVDIWLSELPAADAPEAPGRAGTPLRPVPATPPATPPAVPPTPPASPLAEEPAPPAAPAPASPRLPAEERRELAERLHIAARQLRGRPHELVGADLFHYLLRQLPGRELTDPDTLTLLYDEVWGWKNDPDLPGALELARSCPPHLLVATRIHYRLIAWLTHSGEITDDRCALARQLLRHEREQHYELNSVKHFAAELLVSGQDIATGGEPAAAARRFLEEALNRPHTVPSDERVVWARRRLRRYHQNAGLPPPFPQQTDRT